MIKALRRSRCSWIGCTVVLLLPGLGCDTAAVRGSPGTASQDLHIPLPPASATGGAPLQQTIATRRSERTLAEDPLGLSALAQLLWAAQGVTEAIPEAPAGFGNFEWGEAFGPRRRRGPCIRWRSTRW